jgi:hypothetical protein
MSILPLALRKNSKLTTLANKTAIFLENKWARSSLLAFFYLLLWIFCSYLFYRRFPNNYREPNFFGEEGSIFSKNIIDHGFFSAIGTTFNGYYIWGLYLLEKIGFTVNDILYHGEFINLARSFAITSYLFLGFVATLPWLLFRKYLKLPALILMTLLIVYVPLGGWDYGVLGAFGNMKFALIFITFMLIIYRNLLPENSKKIYFVDIALLICAYTNITVYVMMPFALIRYWPKLKGRKKFWPKLKKILLTDRSLQGLIVLGLALLPQLYIIHKYGVPATPGYLDNPYHYNRTVEIFISRSYLYEIFFTFNKHLNDFWVVVSSLLFLGLAWKLAKQYRQIFVIGTLTIFFATFLFVIKRTGVSDFFIGYKDPGPAQFFFTQNWIFAFLFSILLVELISKLKRLPVRLGLYLVFIFVIIHYMAPMSGSFGKNNFMEKGVGNIYQVAQTACEKDKESKIDIAIYPTKDQVYRDINRSRLCTSTVQNYQPTEITFGLAPYQNNYLTLATTPKFTQTFKSPQKDLDGLTVYFSTFTHKVKSPYDLILMDQSCKNTIRDVQIKTTSLADNAFATVSFDPIANSANQTYCFSIKSEKTAADPLAVQLSAANNYPEGATNLEGKLSDKDVVFMLHYKNNL